MKDMKDNEGIGKFQFEPQNVEGKLKENLKVTSAGDEANKDSLLSP